MGNAGHNYPENPAQRGYKQVTFQNIPSAFYENGNAKWEYRESWYIPSGAALIYSGTPMWNYSGVYIKQVQYGEVLSSSSTTLTMYNSTTYGDDEDNFAVDDVVWLMSPNGEQKEYLGAITGINTTAHTIAVTIAPVNAGSGILYVAKANHATATSSAAAAITWQSNGETNDVATIWYGITVTAGHEDSFKVGDYVYETDTAGTANFKSLGRVAYIDYANHIIYVTIAPAVTGGGKLNAGGQEPTIIGLTDWDAAGTDTVRGDGDSGILTRVDGIVYKSRLGYYGGTTSKADLWVQAKVKADLPRFHITTLEMQGI